MKQCKNPYPPMRYENMTGDELLERATIIHGGETTEFRASNVDDRTDGKILLDRDGYREKGLPCGKTRHPDATIVASWRDKNDDHRVESGPIEKLGFTQAHVIVTYEDD